MLVCKIEMWPGGDENHPRKRELQRILIANVGGTNKSGDYEVVIPKSTEYAKRAGPWKRGRVRGFPRLRLGPADLLLRALIACVGGRSPESDSFVVDGPHEAGLGDPPDVEATS